MQTLLGALLQNLDFHSWLWTRGQKLQELNGARSIGMKMTIVKIKGRQPSTPQLMGWSSFPSPTRRMLANCFSRLFHTARSEDDFLDYTSAKFSIFKTPGIHSISSALTSFQGQLMGIHNVAIAPYNYCQETLGISLNHLLSCLVSARWDEIVKRREISFYFKAKFYTDIRIIADLLGYLHQPTTWTRGSEWANAFRNKCFFLFKLFSWESSILEIIDTSF